MLLFGPPFPWGTVRLSNTAEDWNGPDNTNFQNDNPRRPKLQFWFGPLSMADFCLNARKFSSSVTGHQQLPFQHWPGNIHQGEMWITKAAIYGALANIQTSHPNDFVTMSYYSNPAALSTTVGNAPGRFNRIRAPLGRNYELLKGAMWYPVAAMAGSNTVSDWGNVSAYDFDSTNESPYARGSTTYGHSLMLLHNQFSTNNDNTLAGWSNAATGVVTGEPLAGAPNGESGGLGRRGAQKIVIFESDGVANTRVGRIEAGGGFGGLYVTGAASNSYYRVRVGKAGTSRNEQLDYVSGGDDTDNSDGFTETVEANILKIVDNMVANEASGGFTYTRKPVLIHTIMFGKRDNGTDFSSTDRQILRKMQFRGKTQASEADDLVADKIINQTTLALKRQALENAFNVIMNDGIQLALID
jgi:hypothetical protein